MAFKFIDMKQKNLKLMQFLYIQEKFQMIFLQAVWRWVKFMDMFYDFGVGYNAIAVNDILDIHK